MFTGSVQLKLLTYVICMFACFSWLGMLIRCCVAALDFNFNVNRRTKVSADGHQMYKMKVHVWLQPRSDHEFCTNFQIDRTGQKMAIVHQKVKKDYTFQNNILELCVDSLERRRIPNPTVRIHNNVDFVCLTIGPCSIRLMTL